MGNHCYFPLTAMFGRLYGDGPLTYCDEAVVDMLVERVVHRKARTEAELLAIIKESEACQQSECGCARDWREL